MFNIDRKQWDLEAWFITNPSITESLNLCWIRYGMFQIIFKWQQGNQNKLLQVFWEDYNILINCDKYYGKNFPDNKELAWTWSENLKTNNQVR